ncbi:MAG: hypothetical protein MJH08_08500, partial [Hyphomicrobiales bacterium]|nr:hypothetical protein [Hyphomicrobiales bacterium]
EIKRAQARGEYQWALELIDRLLRLDENDKSITAIKAELLRQRAKMEINCPTRNYYLQTAKELDEID